MEYVYIYQNDEGDCTFAFKTYEEAMTYLLSVYLDSFESCYNHLEIGTALKYIREDLRIMVEHGFIEGFGSIVKVEFKNS